MYISREMNKSKMMCPYYRLLILCILKKNEVQLNVRSWESFTTFSIFLLTDSGHLLCSHYVVFLLYESSYFTGQLNYEADSGTRKKSSPGFRPHTHDQLPPKYSLPSSWVSSRTAFSLPPRGKLTLDGIHLRKVLYVYLESQAVD